MQNQRKEGDVFMTLLLLLGAIVIVACIIGNKISSRLGIPTLLFFIVLGMIFGSDGLLKIEFSDYKFAEQICSSALIFIMFYGGFGTKWSEAKPVAVKSILLSTIGVLITAILTGLFCHFVLHMNLLEGMLIGAVLSSTDAASVFSILRSQKLNLKYGTASMLEIESGSNDPCAYMMTIILLTIMSGKISTGEILYSIFAQVTYGIVCGVIIALITGYMLRNFSFATEGFDSILVVASALASYAIPTLIGGNGYLSAYLAGILLGNQDFPNKKALVNFFDAFNGMMQMLIFFLLGLLVFPSELPKVLAPAILIALFLTVIARPIAVALLLTPFGAPFHQQFVISFAGLRGAASIVFAIMTAVSPSYGKDSLFHIVFCVVLLSILFQGAFLPLISRTFHMIDDNENVLKTFNDYSDETNIQFIQLSIMEDHPWVNRPIKDISLMSGTLIAVIIRNEQVIVPKGNTTLKAGDLVVIGAEEYHGKNEIHLKEIVISENHKWNHKKISELDILKDSIIVMIKRKTKDLIPDGTTQLQTGDTVVLYSHKMNPNKIKTR